MPVLPLTNIVVDEFSHCKKNLKTKFVHFLTHMHSDHFVGLSNNWDFGNIYCSPVTANLLHEKFPGARQAFPVEINVKHTVELSDQLSVSVTLLDANHCPGAVMFLFEGYMGTYLYTGDIRFDKEIFERYTDIYPLGLRNPSFEGCSRHIDILFLDNTFCDPIFTFPPRAKVLEDIEAFVQRCKEQKRRVLIALDSLGKEELLVHLAHKFKSLIVVSPTKYRNVLHAGLDSEIFTTYSSEGWIEVVGKKAMKVRLVEDPEAVGIIPTGWSNSHFSSFSGRLHMFPYSLHSNYSELYDFVRSIKPARIDPIVRNFKHSQKLSDDYGELVNKDNAMYKTSQLQQTGLFQLEQFVTKEYSQAFLSLFMNPSMQQEISSLFNRYRDRTPTEYSNLRDMEPLVRESLKRAVIKEHVMVQRDDTEEIQQLRKRIDGYKQKLFEKEGRLEDIDKPMKELDLQRRKSLNKQKEIEKEKKKRKQGESEMEIISEVPVPSRECLKRASGSPVKLRVEVKPKQPSLHEESNVMAAGTLLKYFKKLVRLQKEGEVIMID